MSNREGAVCPEMSNRFPNQLLMWKIFVLLCGVSASAYADRVSVSVEVRDEEGLPISNAVVSVSTQKKLIFGYGSRPDHFEWTSNRTDSSGMATIRFRCLTADFKCFVSSADHYSEHVPHGRFAAHDDLKGGVEFDSTQTNLSFTLRRRINPVPMHSFGAMTKYSMPAKNGSWGYDLQLGDWVSPHGNGQVADFEIETFLEEFNPIQTSRPKYDNIHHLSGGSFGCCKLPKPPPLKNPPLVMRWVLRFRDFV